MPVVGTSAVVPSAGTASTVMSAALNSAVGNSDVFMMLSRNRPSRSPESDEMEATSTVNTMSDTVVPATVKPPVTWLVLPTASMLAAPPRRSSSTR